MQVRIMTKNDIQLIHAIELAAWGDSAASIKQLETRLETFQEGSVVAEQEGGEIVGYAAAQLVNSISIGSWIEQTDNGYIKRTHKPNGQLVYGVSMAALPKAANLNVSKYILDYYFDTFIVSGRCNILCLGSRLPGFAKYQRKTRRGIQEYLRLNHKGYSKDPELKLYQKNGFELLWRIENYFSDNESLDYGAMIIKKPW